MCTLLQSDAMQRLLEKILPENHEKTSGRRMSDRKLKAIIKDNLKFLFMTNKIEALGITMIGRGLDRDMKTEG